MCYADNMELDTEALYQALDRRRRELRISFREICRQAGVSGASVTTKLGHGSKVNSDNLIRLICWLGETSITPYIRQS